MNSDGITFGKVERECGLICPKVVYVENEFLR
jgi:hypothetical protein